MNMNYPLSSSVVVFHPDGRILSVTRRGRPDLLCTPGGKVDPGETPLQSAARETFEETGLTIPTERLFLFFEAVCPGEVDYHSFSFMCEWNEDMGEPQQMEEGIGVQWVDIGTFLEPDRCAFLSYNTQAIPLALEARGKHNGH